jgi:hypothetical protein
VEHAAGAYAALVQEIFDATDGTYVGRGLATALGADRLIDARVMAEPAQLPATGAGPFRCKCTWVTAFANGAFVPVSHRLSRFTTMRAHLWRDRAANHAEHLAFALAAARPDAATPFAPHDRTLPANAAEIRLPIASEPHHRTHAATATTRSNWRW